MRKSSVKTLSNQFEKDTTPIFTIFSDDTESKKTDSNSNIDRSSNSPRRWTQVLCALKVCMYDEIKKIIGFYIFAYHWKCS